MDSNLKKAWKDVVNAKDLDIHMERIGQAETNAGLIQDMLEEFPLNQNSTIYMPGCGTGQVFDYLSGGIFNRYRFIFGDINKSFLKRLVRRVASKGGGKYKIVEDDLENSQLHESIDACITVLVLEHIDWSKGVETLVKCNSKRLFFIIQAQCAKTPLVAENHEPNDSILKFAKIARPHLIKKVMLVSELKSRGFALRKTYKRKVPNEKMMVGLVFDKII